MVSCVGGLHRCWAYSQKYWIFKRENSKNKELFIVKHDLGGESIERFAPRFEIAQSWNRLMNGNIKEHDLTLLKHEIYERKLI